jgi:hypothetical protein
MADLQEGQGRAERVEPGAAGWTLLQAPSGSGRRRESGNVSANVSAATHVREWTAKKVPGQRRNVSGRVSARVSGLADGDGDPNLRPRSRTVCRPAFDALDREWAALVRSPDAAAALRRWSSAPELAAPDLDTLVAAIWRALKTDADRACAQLAGRAPSDKIAARVLLQVLRPGLRNLGRRLALGGSFDDVDQELLSLAWERIRTYRVDRRPTAIAANILLDVRKAYIRAIVDPRGKLVSLDGLPERRWPAAASAEHEAIDSHLPSLRRAHARLAAAVDTGAITAVSAAVVWRTRVQQHDDVDVAAELGVAVRTLQRRRQRAERELAKAS